MMMTATGLEETADAPQCEEDSCSRDPRVPVWFCTDCDCTYCDSCWAKQVPHRPGKVGLSGFAHQKINHKTYERLKRASEGPKDRSEAARLHYKDAHTTWFGVRIDADGKAVYQDHGRFSALMTGIKQVANEDKYPRIVSFIGATGMCWLSCIYDPF